MYNRILVPLDGSKTAEKVLPFARFLARRLKLPVELLEVIDVAEIGRRIPPDKAQFVGTALESVERNSAKYLNKIAGTFPEAVVINCTVEKGTPAEVIVDKAAADKSYPYQHGHSWPFGDQPLAIGEHCGKGVAEHDQSAAINSSHRGSKDRRRGHPQIRRRAVGWLGVG